MSTYLLIPRRNQAELLRLPEEEMLIRIRQFSQCLREKGVLRGFGVIVLEGQYDRPQEALGFYLIEAADQEAAHAIAKECPILPVGGSVEIRETEFFQEVPERAKL